MAKKTQQEAKVTAQQEVKVNAMGLLRALNIEWALDGISPGDLDIVQAKVSAGNNDEWASWWTPYRRVDGNPVPGISWGVSAPERGGIIILRLVEGGEVKATLKVYRTGKGILAGSPPVIRALLARPDLPIWREEDTAALL
jgi:hypothetical protein